MRESVGAFRRAALTSNLRNTRADPGSIQAGFPRRFGTAAAETGMVVQIRRVILVLTTQDAVAANLAYRVPVGKLGMRDIAHGTVGALAAGATVTGPVASAPSQLRTRFQYGDHVADFSPWRKRFNVNCGPPVGPATMISSRSRPLGRPTGYEIPAHRRFPPECRPVCPGQ